MKKIIAIAGNATCGKDTLFRALKHELESHEPWYLTDGRVERIAFADALKEEVDDFLKKTIGISAWTTNPDEKKLIRKFLIFWGTEFRRGQDDMHWVNLSAEKMCDPNTIYIVTDLRYENEYDWIKEQEGTVIYLDRYINEEGTLVAPANHYEAENNKFLKANADLHLAWPTYDEDDIQAQRAFVRKHASPYLHLNNLTFTKNKTKSDNDE